MCNELICFRVILPKNSVMYRVNNTKFTGDITELFVLSTAIGSCFNFGFLCPLKVITFKVYFSLRPVLKIEFMD